ncbi:hypothetical protein GCM10010402_18690 [Actinomadura luteofluorescens]|uniref:AAA family ATPase n=1 Tax=Actinomadura luteofluorescens TaxID=46163 RepID=UPI0021640103|nr:AAA family ATPase [Actinomadura glauciflava]
MSIRVMLAVGDLPTAAVLRALLDELTGVVLTAEAATAADVAAAVAAEAEPDVLLLHHTLDGFPTTDLVRELTGRHPALAIIVVVEEPTTDQLGLAMEAGARGVIDAHPSLAELQHRTGAAADWSRTMRHHLDPGSGGDPGASRRGYTVAVCGAKGGTGTTLLAVHLALSAVGAGRRVCLVDLDLQTGDLQSYLDITHRRSIADLGAAADDLDGTVLADALFAHRDGPHVLLAPAEGERAEEVTETATRQILVALRSRYDAVIVDCGAQLTDANAVAIETADRVLVTASPDLPALRGVRRLVELWERLSVRKKEDVGVVLVRHSRRDEVQPDFARRVLTAPLLKTAVPADFRAVEEAVNTGAPGNAASSSYRSAVEALAREIGLHEWGAARRRGRPGHGRRTRDRARRGGGDSGAAVTEFAAVLPLIGLLLLVAYQVVLVGVTAVYATLAAGEGARAVAVLGNGAADGPVVRERVASRIAAPWDRPDRLRLSSDGDWFTATVRVPAVLPGTSGLFDLHARARVVHEEKGAEE